MALASTAFFGHKIGHHTKLVADKDTKPSTLTRWNYLPPFQLMEHMNKEFILRKKNFIQNKLLCQFQSVSINRKKIQHFGKIEVPIKWVIYLPISDLWMPCLGLWKGIMALQLIFHDCLRMKLKCLQSPHIASASGKFYLCDRMRLDAILCILHITSYCIRSYRRYQNCSDANRGDQM